MARWVLSAGYWLARGLTAQDGAHTLNPPNLNPSAYGGTCGVDVAGALEPPDPTALDGLGTLEPPQCSLTAPI